MEEFYISVMEALLPALIKHILLISHILSINDNDNQGYKSKWAFFSDFQKQLDFINIFIFMILTQCLY